ncbi:hypothetical protein [Saccharothrix sp. HUAS TT1]|uniref:hypothetical protein n=1 Tax=unclassified Saccharothrix TaxID=2593673 RepID=UPI00345B7638
MTTAQRPESSAGPNVLVVRGQTPAPPGEGSTWTTTESCGRQASASPRWRWSRPCGTPPPEDGAASDTPAATAKSAADLGGFDELVAPAKRLKGGDRAPDVFDLGLNVALAKTDVFAPYQVRTWADIPDELKEPSGLYYGDYGGSCTGRDRLRRARRCARRALRCSSVLRDYLGNRSR